MRSRFILLLIVFFSVHAHAQVFSIKNYTTSDGLINNRINTVNQDGKGYIWIGTDYGICRYDGKTIKYFNLPGFKGYYRAACSRPYRQYVLFSTNFGVTFCCGDSIINFDASPRRSFSPSESLALNDSVFLVTDYSGVLKIEKNKTTALLSLPVAMSSKVYPLVLLRDAASNIWLGLSNNTIVFPKGNFNDPRILPQFSDMYLNIIKEDSAGNLYIGTDHGLFRLKKEQLVNPLQPAEKLFSIHENIISGLAFDGTGHAWMSNRYGVRKFSDDFKKSILITPENGLASFNAWDAFCDRENNLWFATENGVSKIINTAVVNYSFPLNEFPNIKAGLVWDDSTFYYSNGVSLHKMVNDKNITVTGFHDEAGYLEQRLWKTPDGKLLININSINNLIFGVPVTKEFAASGNTVIPQNSKSSDWNKYGYINLASAYNDKEGNMWYCAAGGLALYKSKRIFKYDIRDKKNVKLFIASVTRDSFGDLWLGAKDNIVRCRLSPQADSFSLQTKEVIDTATLDRQSYVKILCDSRSRIWSGGYSGSLVRIDRDADLKITGIRKYTAPEISGMRIRDLLENENGDIWVGTNFGIDIFSTQADGSVTIRKDAYASELCGKDIYFLKRQQHKIYVGTTGCMAVIDLTEKNIPTPAPNIFINAVRIGNNFSDVFLHTDGYRLPADSNTLSFYFNATSFLNAGVKYSYMLEGGDNVRSIPVDADNITYSQLRPGKYTFKVWAQNADGVWSLQPATKTFFILTPWYNSIWFYILFAAVFFCLLYLVYRYRVNQIKKLHVIRENISNDLHDDIGSTLSSITVMSNLLKQKIETNPDQSAALASQIEDSGRQMIYAMSDIVWSIKPGNDILDQLINRLREYMNIMLENTMDDYALITEGDISTAPINMYMRRDIYLTCKEIIHNTAKYASAKTLVMKISSNGSVNIHAKDDGKGFDFDRVKKGNGLNNIFLRVRANKGTVNCITSPGNGTEWDIRIPL